MIQMLKRPKLVALFAAVALGDRAVRGRDRLMAMFWPDSTPSRASHSLSQALYEIKEDLGEVIERHGDYLVADSAQVWCDVVAFEEAVAEGRHKDAVGLYRGDLLEGLYLSDAPDFEQWVEGARTALRRTAAASLWSLAESYAAEGRVTEASATARRAQGLTPGEEAALQRLLGFLDGVGDRAGAIAAFGSFAERLQREYELEPSPETVEMVRQLREREEPFGAVSPLRPTVGTPVVGAPRGEAEVLNGMGSVPGAAPSRRESSPWLRAAFGIAAAAVVWLAYAKWVAAPPPDPRRVAVVASGLDDGPGAELARTAVRELQAYLSSVDGLTIVPTRMLDGPSLAEQTDGLQIGTLVTLEGWGQGPLQGISVQIVDPGLRRIVTTGTFSDSAGLGPVARFVRQRIGDIERERRAGATAPGERSMALLTEAGRLSAAAQRHSVQGRHQLALDLFGAADSVLAEAETVDPRWIEPPLRRGWTAHAQYLALGRIDTELPGAPSGSEVLEQALEILAVGEQHAERALGLDPGSPFALELRGSLRHSRLEQSAFADTALMVATEADLRRAVEILPELAGVWVRLARIHRARGENVQLLVAWERATQADPFLEYDRQTAWSVLYAAGWVGDREIAVQTCERGQADYPEDPVFKECDLFLMYWFPGMVDLRKGRTILDALDADTDPAVRDTRDLRLMYLAGANVHAGLPDSALALIDAKRARPPGPDSIWADVAEVRVLTLLGRPDAALARITQRVAASPGVWPLLRSDPHFQGLLGEPGFTELLAQRPGG